jgi:hypothetical protein
MCVTRLPTKELKASYKTKYKKFETEGCIPDEYVPTEKRTKKTPTTCHEVLSI